MIYSGLCQILGEYTREHYNVERPHQGKGIARWNLGLNNLRNNRSRFIRPANCAA